MYKPRASVALQPIDRLDTVIDPPGTILLHFIRKESDIGLAPMDKGL